MLLNYIKFAWNNISIINLMVIKDLPILVSNIETKYHTLKKEL